MSVAPLGAPSVGKHLHNLGNRQQIAEFFEQLGFGVDFWWD
jgi:hypothetical protein